MTKSNLVLKEQRNENLRKQVPTYLVTNSCPALCNPMDCNKPGSSVCGISQARILERGTNSFPRGSSQSSNGTYISCTGRQVFYYWTTREAQDMNYQSAIRAKLLPSCVTVCKPTDCSPPGSSVHGILQARILEWAAISSSRGSSRPRDRTRVSYVSCIGRKVPYHEDQLWSP